MAATEFYGSQIFEGHWLPHPWMATDHGASALFIDFYIFLI